MAKDAAYREAENWIDEAWRSKAPKLGLSNMGLTELPVSIVKCKNLVELNISDNNLTALPESLGKLTQLQSLNLSNNRVTALPESLGNLTNLKNLRIEDNQLATLPKSLGQLANLRSLVLVKNHLVSLPETLSQLLNLEVLNIYENRLDLLPDWIGQLKSLKSLGVGCNNIKGLPNSIIECSSLIELNLGDHAGGNPLQELPKQIGSMRALEVLHFGNCHLHTIPEWIINLGNLHSLGIHDNPIGNLSESFRSLTSLEKIWASNCNLYSLPNWVGELKNLDYVDLEDNCLDNLPSSFTKLEHLKNLRLNGNPLNPELAEAYEQGLEAVKAYLRAKAAAQITLNEAKLILVGEGEVGKTCLLNALRDEPFVEGLPTTHGIEIKSFKLTDPATQKEITLNGWDFGGQRGYRSTHQLFFSAPAVYLVVWKPREGPQQGFVKVWIQLIKRREPSAKILVIATHGGPKQRQPDIDRQELWDLFGKDTVAGFFFVDSKPDENGKRKGITELKDAIARVAATLPEVGRSVPKSFADVRAALGATDAPYMPFDEVLAICRAQDMDDEIARLFITISHRLGHLTHYENDPALRDIVILRPDWLATAMSYVLDDEETRKAHGLVDFSRLSLLWNDPTRPADTRYPDSLHRIFLRLMERFDLSYRVAGLSKDDETNPVSLIAQLVPDTTPKEEDFNKAWFPEIASGDIQQTQICRIVDEKGNSANAEGLFSN